jgi:hypothetical protein
MGHWKPAALPSNETPIFWLGEFNSNQHIVISVTATGVLRARLATTGIGSAPAGTILGTGTTPYTVGVHNHIEVEFKIDDTVGRCKVYLNGNATAEIDFTGDTRNAGSGNVSSVRFGGGANSIVGGQDWDNVIFWDNGGTLAGQIGECKIETLLPSGDGNSSQFTGSDGNSTNNSLLVDEATPNDDTDYVEDGTSGHKDTYAFGNLTTTSGAVKGLCVTFRHRKSDANAAGLKPVVRHSTTDYVGSSQTEASGYYRSIVPYDVNPGTGVAFTITDVNVDEFGVQVA